MTIASLPSLQSLARALGGEVSGSQVLAPGPGHSASDRSLSIKLDPGAPDGFVVNSFAGDDPITCKDYVRSRAGIEPFKANGKRKPSFDIGKIIAAQSAGSGKPKANIIAAYDYTDESGVLLYQVCRFEPKDFRQRRPDGQGGWIWSVKDCRRVPYRLPDLLKFPDASVFVCEGEKDADRVASLNQCATTVACGDWTPDCIKALAGRDVLILEDNDDAGRKKAIEAATALHGAAMSIRIVRLPDLPEKGDVSDWLDADPRRAEKLAEVCFNAPAWAPAAVPPPCAIDDVHAAFRKWLGDKYDIDAVDATIATAAAERLEGDPLWLLIVSGPGAAKTETVQALAGCGAHITSTIQSEGALLSASSKRERSKNATGGLLRKIGKRGILVIKDVTSILSSDRNVRAQVLAAIREVYDGRWERNVGSDGGQTLTWTGRLIVVGAVTTAWDSAHSVVTTMGDRFVLVRINSNEARAPSGRKAIRNTGQETAMREELAAAVGGVVCHARTDVPLLQEEDQAFDAVLNAADIVTKARTAVERDYQGEIIDAHAPEMPTRFAKQLTQMVRGGIAVGMTPERALQLALRCARDSIPPLRLSILADVAKHPGTRPGDTRKRINKPWRTVKREMEALHMIGMLTCDEEETTGSYGEEKKTIWRYRLDVDDIGRTTLLAMVGNDGNGQPTRAEKR